MILHQKFFFIEQFKAHHNFFTPKKNAREYSSNSPQDITLITFSNITMHIEKVYGKRNREIESDAFRHRALQKNIQKTIFDRKKMLQSCEFNAFQIS